MRTILVIIVFIYIIVFIFHNTSFSFKNIIGTTFWTIPYPTRVISPALNLVINRAKLKTHHNSQDPRRSFNELWYVSSPLSRDTYPIKILKCLKDICIYISSLAQLVVCGCNRNYTGLRHNNSRF